MCATLGNKICVAFWFTNYTGYTLVGVASFYSLFTPLTYKVSPNLLGRRVLVRTVTNKIHNTE